MSWNPISWIVSAGSWLADLTADIFWGLVTSYPAIAILGVAAAVSFAVSHTPKLVRWAFPPVAAYTRAAAIVCLVSSAWMMLAVGYRIADGRDEIERLKNNLAWSEFMLGEQSAALDSAHELKRKADAEADQAKGTLNEYKSRFGSAPGVCAPPPGYLDWLRSLQRRRTRAAGADQPQRNLVSRVRAFGGQRQ